GQVQHRLPSHIQQDFVLKMPQEHRHKLRVSLRTPHRQGMPQQPQHQAGQPQLQTQPDCGSQRTVGNGHGTWCPAQQNLLGQCPVQRHLETVGECGHSVHATTAPPEKLKKDRKNEEAAKAMERPNTICTSLRKPPEVSPKASANPVAIMAITATIRATGPWMESRMDCSGPSQGMLEPAACAVVATHSNNAANIRAFKPERKTGFTEIRIGWAAVMMVLQLWLRMRRLRMKATATGIRRGDSRCCRNR